MGENHFSLLLKEATHPQQSFVFFPNNTKAPGRIAIMSVSMENYEMNC